MALFATGSGPLQAGSAAHMSSDSRRWFFIDG
jgi:hypothetical protein